MRLKEAQFVVSSVEQFNVVFNAFTKPYPSLDWVSGHDLYRWAEALANLRPEDGAEAGERLQKALEAASCGGEWPGSIKAYFAMLPSGSMRLEKIEVVPYVGDRKFIVSPYGDGRYFIVCDYTSRPSESAAEEVIKLLQRAKRWWTDDPGLPLVYNEPAWEEVRGV